MIFTTSISANNNYLLKRSYEYFPGSPMHLLQGCSSPGIRGRCPAGFFDPGALRFSRPTQYNSDYSKHI